MADDDDKATDDQRVHSLLTDRDREVWAEAMLFGAGIVRNKSMISLPYSSLRGFAVQIEAGDSEAVELVREYLQGEGEWPPES